MTDGRNENMRISGSNSSVADQPPYNMHHIFDGDESERKKTRVVVTMISIYFHKLPNIFKIVIRRALKGYQFQQSVIGQLLVYPFVCECMACAKFCKLYCIVAFVLGHTETRQAHLNAS